MPDLGIKQKHKEDLFYAYQVIVEDAKKRGIGKKEIVKELRDYGFLEMNIHNVYGNVPPEKTGALEVEKRDKWFKEKYQAQIKSIASKPQFYPLHPDGFPGLFSDLSEIYVITADKFNQKAQEGSGRSEQQAFEAYLFLSIRRKLTDLARQSVNSREKFNRSMQSITTLEELGRDEKDMPEVSFEEELFSQKALEEALEALPSSLKEVVEYILVHFRPGGLTQMWKEIREKWNQTPKSLARDLKEYPVFMSYIGKTAMLSLLRRGLLMDMPLGGLYSIASLADKVEHVNDRFPDIWNEQVKSEDAGSLIYLESINHLGPDAE